VPCSSDVDPETAARNLIEIANSVEAVDGRIHIEKINGRFLYDLRGGPSLLEVPYA
jgi:hypothetical protein